jgi:hypothetical protein
MRIVPFRPVAFCNPGGIRQKRAENFQKFREILEKSAKDEFKALSSFFEKLSGEKREEVEDKPTNLEESNKK